MAILDSQKVDYLWKKLGYGATKTDTNANKKAPNEAIASPLIIRGDKVWQQSANIPAVLPASSDGVVTVYPTSLPDECTLDGTATANRTWLTGLTDWIPPELGSTYQVKVYIHTSGDAAGASGGDQVFATGSGNDDEWFFDYQSGVLHFVGENLPNGISFTGKSVYISGGRYTGTFGVGASAGEDANLGNLTISDVTITSTTASDNIILDAEDGYVVISGSSAFQIPSGSTAERPGSPSAGYMRFNTSTGQFEVYDGAEWDAPTATITSQAITPDGSANAFVLSSSTTTNSVIVSINGTVQQPTTAYSVSGNVITFTEIPEASDIVEVRTLGTGVQSINEFSLGSTYIKITDDSGPIKVNGAVVTENANVNVATSGVATTIDSFPIATYRTAKYVIQATDGSDFESSEVLVTHDGTTAYRTQYAVVNSNGSLGDISVTISGADLLVQYTSANNDTDVRFSKNYLII
jgi:hypothetical protein